MLLHIFVCGDHDTIFRIIEISKTVFKYKNTYVVTL